MLHTIVLPVVIDRALENALHMYIGSDERGNGARAGSCVFPVVLDMEKEYIHAALVSLVVLDVAVENVLHMGYL